MQGNGERASTLIGRRNYRNLDVWHRAFALTKDVYGLTEGFPRSEEFGLKSQMRRSAVSVPSNIAEGYMRQSKVEYARFLGIALGSVAELQTQLLLAKELLDVDERRVDLAVEESEHVTAILMKLVRVLNDDRKTTFRGPLPMTRGPLPRQGQDV